MLATPMKQSLASPMTVSTQVSAKPRPQSQSQSQLQSQSVAPSPGNFRHPRLTEIVSRQKATSFTPRDLQNATINGVVLLATFILSGILHSWTSILLRFVPVLTSSVSSAASSPASTTYVQPELVVNIFRIFLLTNVILSLRPLLPYISKKDDMSDIPLTPSQRKLLGLPSSTASTSVASSPSAAQPVTRGGYVTPPRYRRFSGSSNFSSPNSNASSPTDRRSVSAIYDSSSPRSILSFNSLPSSTPHRRAGSGNGSPFASTITSPLLHKALTATASQRDYIDSRDSNGGFSTSNFGGDGGLLRRSQSLQARASTSAGTSLARGTGGASVREPSTPSPGSGAGAGAGRNKKTPGLNYKWMYDKGYNISSLDGSFGY